MDKGAVAPWAPLTRGLKASKPQPPEPHSPQTGQKLGLKMTPAGGEGPLGQGFVPFPPLSEGPRLHVPLVSLQGCK